jgi:hypothetical protein
LSRLTAVPKNPSMQRRLALPVIGGVASLLLVGCGSSGGGSLTPAQLASRGSAICARAASEERKLQAQDAQQLGQALPRVQAIAGRELGELAKLSPPPSERAAYHDLLTTGSEIMALLKPLSSQLTAGQEPSAELLAHGRRLAARLGELDAPLGMGVCSSFTSA